MQTVSVELKVPKEIKDVADLLDAVIAKVRSKAELSQYSELIPKLMSAIDGVENIADEINSEYRDEAVAYLTQMVVKQLLPYTPPVPDAPLPEEPTGPEGE